MSRWDPDRILDELSREADALERVRQEVIQKGKKGNQIIMWIILGAVVLGGLITAAAGNPVPLFVMIPVALIASLIVYHVYFGKGKARYLTMFKVGFLQPMVKHIEPGMNYDPSRGISESVFIESGLYGSRPDRYSSQDLFHGNVGETSLMFSEVHAEEKHTSTDSKGNTTTTWTTIFQGILFIADFHKEFRSPVSVMPDFAEKTFGWFGKKLQKLGGNLQKLENPEFEKHFVVRGADAVETRYILTPKMQECLVELRRRVGDGLRVGFRDSHVWMTIPESRNWFEGNIQLPANDRNQLKEILFQLWSCFSIVENLDLNTRIWTKR